MARFNLDDYIDVAERIEQFYAKYPNGSITTELLNVGGWNGKQTQFIVQAHLWDREESEAKISPRLLLASGLAEESFGNSGPNQTSALENAETSAIGRAIANLGFQRSREGQRQRPSRQEMEKVERGNEPTLHDALRAKLSEKFGTPDERKQFIETTLGHSVESIPSIDPAEVAVLLIALG